MLRAAAQAPRLAVLLVLASLAPAHAATGPTGSPQNKGELGKVEVPNEAVAGSPVTDGRARVVARLVTDVNRVTPGETFKVGVLFQLDPGWHIYWHNPGNAGFATDITWEVGDASIGPLAWPAPTVFRELDGATVTYGYQDEVLLFATATVSDSVGQNVNLVARARYLACNIICSPGEVRLRRVLPVGRDTVPADPSIQSLFARSKKRVPVAASALGLTASAELSQTPLRPGDDFSAALTLTTPCDNARPCPVYRTAPEPFIPATMPMLQLRVVGTRPPPTGGGLALIMRGHVVHDDEDDGPATGTTARDHAGNQARHDDDDDNEDDDDEDDAASHAPALEHIRGVVFVERDGALLQPVEIDVPVAMAAAETPIRVLDNPLLTAVPEALRSAVALPTTAPTTASRGPDDASGQGATTWLQALALAFLGGLLLNLMPCVLPVLAIKVIGVTQLGHFNRRTIALHGALYTLGVVLSMLVLAAVVLVLKALGTQVGWGFQFQEPWFVAAVSCVLVLFALNCFGVFEIYTGAGALGRVGADTHGLRRSFFDGILAVVLATPCSAPFLGTAVAFALTQGGPITVSIFALIGLGLALPYVLLTLVPGGLRLVPRPGAWMNHVKTVLGFGLIATAVWLIWLIGRFAGVDAMARLMLFLLATTVLAWIYGISSHGRPERQLGLLALFLVALPALAYVSLSFPVALDPEATAPSPSADAWRPYTPAAVHAELAAGHPAFVDFTADWCITCKFNESHVLGDAALRAEFQRYGVALFKADWTRRDETIRHTLATFGKAGVPMYLLYSPDKPTGPRVLPEILTVDQVMEALHSTAPPPEGALNSGPRG